MEKSHEVSQVSMDSRFENSMLSKFEDETYDLNKEVENSFAKIMEART